MYRFVVASLATLPGRFEVDGTPRLRERPIAALVAALRGLGAGVEYLDQDGFAPLAIDGGSLDGGATVLDAGESSQYLSALLMAAVRARRPVEIRVESLTSTPYVELTLEALGRFGVEVERREDGFRIGPQRPAAGRLEVEADYSAAAYPAAAAALTGGDVLLEGLRLDSAQGDRRFLALLEEMGARVEAENSGVRVRGGGRLHAVTADLSSMPDQVPTLAALAAFSLGTTRITGVPHLRLKESDRLHAMALELAKLGVEVREEIDGLVVRGSLAEVVPPVEEVVVETHDDHRIAMSLALVGLRRPGVVVAAPGVVAKSYPAFWRDLDDLLVG
jgi:3-phosphoshikimate 1-carboxyvinyltransferase